ncbi:NTP pyrophosphatase, house-cleaning of non-canonical NTPs [Neorhodopirellula lusitana]|uniref:NTP pyrophosphatase, house-cleaning of non-canonical NTPs n=1 Tax=Neorhodopirellula lusitana TaxID=445327 RepID=A0ABY1PTS1_9BACT|nr:nucleotide pyrophosphohydrolase [Neorhodopirellula lusitana]SMP47502.1 NTP pyrophosphatase, house-cleaning of non-canonical NTPs [Neorhodopirellula lusitana]
MTETNPTDSQTTVTELKAVVQKFVDERDWNSFHNPKNLAMSLAIETAELMEHFQWLTPEEALVVKDDPSRKHAVGEEVADCLSYLLAIASKLEIDLATTLRAKMIRNAVKYPVPDGGTANPSEK